MKKILLIALSLALAFTALACGTSDSANTTETTAKAVYITPGEIDDKANTYKNEYLDICLTLDDTWHVFPSSTIARNNGLSKDTITEDDISALLGDDEVGQAIDFQAYSNDKTKSLTIIYQAYDLEEEGKDEEDFAESMAKQVTDTLEDEGAIDVATAVLEVKVAERECYSMKYSANMNSEKIYGQSVYIINGNNMAVINVFTSVKDTTDDILALFKPVEE